MSSRNIRDRERLAVQGEFGGAQAEEECEDERTTASASDGVARSESGEVLRQRLREGLR